MKNVIFLNGTMVILALITLSSCASILHGSKQEINFTSEPSATAL